MFRRGRLFLIIILTIFCFTSTIKSQSTQAMYYLNFSRSVHSLGIGEQSVALSTSDDAPTYNPANLVFVEKPTFSFFHQPLQMSGTSLHIPINSFLIGFKVEDVGSFGIEYVDWDLGEGIISSLENPEGDGKKYHFYERSFSLGYAREFCDNFSAGIQFRYSKSSLGIAFAEKLFVSTGFNYSPPILDNRLNIGFSLTNFGTKVWYIDEAQSDPPPSKLNLGIGFLPIDNNFYSLQTQLAISKPFDEHPSKSSFEYLFSDWKDFPKDAALHTGIAFNWKPLNLGNGFSFFQEFYLGNYSVGNKTQLSNFYTHGGKIGVEFSGIQFSAGYAGRWHNVHYPSYLSWQFPYETVQFTLGMNEELFFKGDEVNKEYAKPKNIILSFGIGRSIRVGKLKERMYGNSLGTEGFENGNLFFFEGSFYFDEQNAIVSNVSYNPSNYIVKYQGQEYFKSKIEIFSISSSYRYHPLEFFTPIFVQGGLAIVRLNPISQFLRPKYDYKAALLFSTGGIFEIYEGIVLNPFILYNIMFSRLGNTPPRLGGFNQFDLGLKVGYKF